MQIIHNIDELREVMRPWRRNEDVVAFVPTMGNLHDGHLSLIDKAKSLGDRVVASIFVNPMQFDRASDYGDYPRTFSEDIAKLEAMGIDLLFAPSVEMIYPEGVDVHTSVSVPGITDILDGEHRPGHFTGVATVVCKLFNMVMPRVAVFGEKDFQQLQVVKHMTRDLNLHVEIVGAPTAREANGLAMSSRNNYLTAEERSQAGLIYQQLSSVADQILAGSRDYAALEQQAMATLAESGFNPEYFTVREGCSMQLPSESATPESLVILTAAFLGKARLIDNLQITQHLTSSS